VANDKPEEKSPGQDDDSEPKISIETQFPSEENPPPEKKNIGTAVPDKSPLAKGSMAKDVTVNYDPSDLQKYGQASRTFTLPGAAKLHKVSMATLWQSEEDEISLGLSNQVNPLDVGSKNQLRMTEVLTRAIYQIGDKKFVDPENPESEKILKNELRELLGKMSPSVVEIWHYCYNKLIDYRDSKTEKEIVELKKSLELVEQRL